MFSTSIQMPSITTVISTVASIAASLMLIHSIINKHMSPELQDYIYSKLGAFVSSFFTQMTLVIEEFEGLRQNQLFNAADIYLRTIIHHDTHVLKAGLARKQSKIWVSMETNEETIDTFNGVAYKWKLVTKKIESTSISNRLQLNSANSTELIRCFKLRFHKKHKESAFNNYLPQIVNTWKEVEEAKKTLKLFTLKTDGLQGSNPWVSVEFDHPSTFDTLAMDTEMKRRIKDDLDRFVNRKEFYRRVGKAWKRGYLLFGPPGTGKSSLIAAMANHLKIDIYDLELTNIWNNSQLRTLLTSTANRSILLVEDIDCSIELQERSKAAGVHVLDPQRSEKAYQEYHPATVTAVVDNAHSAVTDGRRSGTCTNALIMGKLPEKSTVNQSGAEVTLSGLLNFIDGLWSSCGDERIIVFTTNNKDRLDEALLRPGRMDMHIHMSYCTPRGFRMLASNYHGITRHDLFSMIEQLIEGTKVTPAEVGEQLLKDVEPDVALRGLVEFLQEKKECDEIKASEIALGPSEEEATPVLNGEKVQSKKSQLETHDIQQIID